jgi:hypothetical protein
MATSDVAVTHFEPVNRTFVGRPGLDPGTLGLKEGCIYGRTGSVVSEWSVGGNVGFVSVSRTGFPGGFELGSLRSRWSEVLSRYSASTSSGVRVPEFTVQALFIEPRHPLAGGDFEIVEPSPVVTDVG